MSSGKLAALNGYPTEGPEVPDREKVVREKDRHESGTGRRDREKREGRGPSNWGDPVQDALAAQEEHYEEEEEGEVPDSADPPKKYVNAGQFFDKEEDESHPTVKGVVKVPPKYAGSVKTEDGVQVVVEEPVPAEPNPALAKPAPKKKKGKYVPEEEPETKKEDTDEDQGKQSRDKRYQNVQHQHQNPNPQAPLKTGPPPNH